ncbi:hypothetical protein HPT27_09000 [Permianibacter sp. IMCC34836]|uniref:hypothetical protein n=1 Tax=Permianibacter fluminis TaxID=2738515 RepID=UPI0015574AD8|nr:hypothetical protein [Permianibacter fluminis]NQD37162.1 hypothetical protein [Permianibacter fluminis]
MNADAISDLLLALSCLLIGWRAWSAPAGQAQPGIALAVASIGVAAALGVLSFSGVAAAVGPHDFFSLIATVAGVPLLAASFYWPQSLAARHPRAAALSLIFGGGVGLVMVSVLNLPLWSQLLPAVAIVLIVLTAWRRRARPFWLGTALLIAAFAVLSARLSFAGISSEQGLHVLMSAGLLLLTWPGRPAPASAAAAA